MGLRPCHFARRPALAVTVTCHMAGGSRIIRNLGPLPWLGDRTSWDFGSAEGMQNHTSVLDHAAASPLLQRSAAAALHPSPASCLGVQMSDYRHRNLRRSLHRLPISTYVQLCCVHGETRWAGMARSSSGMISFSVAALVRMTPRATVTPLWISRASILDSCYRRPPSTKPRAWNRCVV